MRTTCLLLLIALTYAQVQVNSGSIATRTTQPCMNGYFWTGQSCMPCIQLSNGYCQCSTYQGCTAVVCSIGYQSTGTNTSPQCSQCPTGCTACSLNTINNAQVCTACASTYQQVGGLCIPKSNCLTFSATTGVCTQCAIGYYFNWNFQQNVMLTSGYAQSTYFANIPTFCTACSTSVTGCNNCNNGGICLACSSGYYYNTSGTTPTCTACPTNCSSCNSTGCTTCNVGAIATSTTTCAVCSVQISNCTVCTFTTPTYSCTTCASGYFLNSSNTCTQCSNNCTACTSATVCTTCQSGYLLNSGNTSCYQCQPNCAPNSCSFVTGTTQTTCTSCLSTFFAIQNNLSSTARLLVASGAPSNAVTTGTSTTTGQTFLSCGQCSAQNSQWNQCAGPFDSTVMATLQPTQCLDSYFLFTQADQPNTCVAYASANTCYTVASSTNTICQQCLVNTTQIQLTTGQCLTCPTKCVAGQCVSSTVEGTTTAICNSCVAGYYVNSGNCSTCSSALTNCALCTSGSNCTQCSATYYLTTAGQCTSCSTANCALCPSNVCQQCQTAMFTVTNTSNASVQCTPCPNNCSQCAQIGVCSLCNSGYVLQGNGCVTLAQANCQSTNSTSGCAVCSYGFYFNTGFCLQCVDNYAGFVCNPNQQYTNGAVPTVTPSVAPTPLYTTGQPLIASQLCYGASGQQANYCPQSQPTAVSCQTGYYWSGQICVVCQSVSNGYCTCGTVLACTAINCNAGYASNGVLAAPQCIACSTGCSTCQIVQTTTNCTVCQNGYTLVGNVCIVNNNCTSFSQTTGICLTCANGYYFTGLQTSTSSTTYTYANYFTYQLQYCSVCGVTNCAICPSQYTCTSCVVGYYWNIQQTGGSCTACPTNCAVCSKNGCTNCVSGYVLNGQNQCASCITTSIPNCASASCDGTTCNTCSTNYGLVTNQCVQCSSNCITCSSSTNCSTCAPGYLLNSNGGCYQCPFNCTTCAFLNNTTTVTCTACQDTFYVNQINGAGSCTSCNLNNNIWLRCAGPFDTTPLSTLQPTQCVQNYFLVQSSTTNSVNQCVPIAAGNSTCLSLSATSAQACQTCQPGYMLINSSCIACPTSCSTCITQNTQIVCSTCMPGKYLASNNLSCSSCPTGCASCQNGVICQTCNAGYYLSATNVCQTCTTANCASCPSNACSTCQPTYFLYTTTSSTTSTTTTPSTTTTACYRCPNNCLTCSNPGQTCLTCSAGYVLKNGGCISLAQANCLTFGSGGCGTCTYGFYLYSGMCFQCVDPLNGFVCSSTA